jgi:hypothetical protein
MWRGIFLYYFLTKNINTMRLIRILTLIITAFSTMQSFAQDPNISVYIANEQYLSGHIYQFDIMMKATGSTSTFQLRTFQAGLYVNPTWVNGGVLTASNAPTYSEMTTPGYNGAFQWNATDKLINCTVNFDVVNLNGCISTTVTTTPIRISRIQVSNSVNFACVTPDIKFNYVANPDPYRLRTSFSWRAVGCTTNYDMFYPGRTFTGSVTYNGELYTANDADGKSPVTTNTQTGFCSGELTVTAFIEGFYVGTGLQSPSLYASVVNHANQEQSDTITILLKPAGNPSGPAAATFKTILYADGRAYCIYPLAGGLIGNSYWIVLKHRNAVETWSANPVTISANTAYDFSSAQNKAYGNNLILTFDNSKWAIFSGDISDAGLAIVGVQDGIVESQDYGDMENAVSIIKSGYQFEDISGDGIVESTDYSIMENNVGRVVFAIYP